MEEGTDDTKLFRPEYTHSCIVQMDVSNMFQIDLLVLLLYILFLKLSDEFSDVLN